MSIPDWYQEYLRKQQKQNAPNSFRGYSNPVQSAINREVFNNYMNQGNEAQQVQNSQKNGATLQSTAGKVAEGFAKGGPIGAIVAAAQAVKKAGKNARRNAQAMGKQTMQNAEQQNKALMADNEIPTAQTPQFNPNDYMVGGAAPVQDINSQVYDQYMNNPQNNAIQSAINANTPDQGILNQSIVADNAANNTAPLNAEVAQEEVKKGLLDKFISGIGDLSRGYQENRNTGFSPENLNRRMDVQEFKNSINPADYTTKLSDEEQAQFNKWASDMKANGTINPNDNFQDYDMQGYWKNEVLNNTDLANGNAQNHFTDKYKMPNHETFSNESIYAKGDNAKYAGRWKDGEFIAPRNENKMTRLGEALGTVGRIAQNPAVQGLIAAGASAAMGNPFALAQGYKYANQRAMSNAYRDVLKQYGVDVPDTGFFGNIGANDMRNIGNMAETHAWHEYLNKKNADELAAKIAKNEADKEYKEKRAATMQQNADTKLQKVNDQKNKPQKTTQNNNRYQLYNGKDGNTYRIDKVTGIITPITSGSVGSGNTGNSGAETEEEFRKKAFNKNSKGWAF